MNKYIITATITIEANSVSDAYTRFEESEQLQATLIDNIEVTEQKKV